MLALIELLKYTIPSLVVLASAYYLLKMFLDKEAEKTQMHLRMDVQKISMPVRMQAYERLILLLERIEPAGLLVRTNLPGMTALQLQSALIQSIRSEFDHNLSQQLYVSTKAWEMVRNAREETIKRVNTAAMQLPADATSADLASLILIHDIDTELSAVKGALDLLKSEARINFF
jgi:predicted solute-binding protein